METSQAGKVNNHHDEEHDEERFLSSPSPPIAENYDTPHSPENANGLPLVSPFDIGWGTKRRLSFGLDLPPAKRLTTGRDPFPGVGTSPGNGAETTRKLNTPVSKKGDRFVWADNMKYHDLPKYPFKTGEENPELLIMRLRTTQGKLCEYQRVNLENPQWDDESWIKRSNEWWHQNIQRHLNRPNPTDPDNTSRSRRNPWSEREFQSIKILVESRLQGSNADGLSANDWKEIAKEHNKRFEGQMLRVGEKLVPSKYKQGRILKKKTKEYITKDQQFIARSQGAVLGAYNRWRHSDHTGAGTEDGEIDMNNVDEGWF